nr:hypothetical protein CFP56_73019 [Quercus suber]
MGQIQMDRPGDRGDIVVARLGSSGTTTSLALDGLRQAGMSSLGLSKAKAFVESGVFLFSLVNVLFLT